VEADLSDLKKYSYFKRIFILKKLDENKTLNVIKELTKDKAPGSDRIPNKVIKRVAGVIPALLTKIFQTYINQGVHLK
jgi:tRNA A37 threonylcarbamoyladenosine synthetase subunit TsaC/SUA5/YrdC